MKSESGIVLQARKEVEARKSDVQGYPQVHSEFKASPGYIRLCTKQIKYMFYIMQLV